MANPIRAASEISLQQLADLGTSAFTGYAGGSQQFTPESIKEFADTSYSLLADSFVYVDPDSNTPLGFCFVAKHPDRPGQKRVSAMGIALDGQGKGIGKKLLAATVEAERQRGTKLLELECISSNERGLRLYKGAGFSQVEELAGWRREVPEESPFPADEQLEEITLEEVQKMIDLHGDQDLVWQLRFPSRAAATVKYACYKLGHAYATVSNRVEGTYRLLSLVVEKEHRGKGEGMRMIKALIAKHAGKKLEAPVLSPLTLGEKFAKELGFEEMELRQFQMRLKLQ